MLGIYCRISIEGDGKRSIETQRAMGISFAEVNKLKYKVYIDSGISGGKNRDLRPELDNLFNDIEKGLITSIYVYNQDRLARDEVTWFQLATIVLEYKVKFYENGVLANLNESGTFTMRGIKAIFDADERRKTSKRFKDVLRQNAEKGRRFSLIQYGYKEGEDKKLIIDEEKAKTVKRIYQMSLDGKGVAKIAEILNNEGIKTSYNEFEGTYRVKNKYTGEVQIRNKSDVTWKGGTINSIITNTIYKGQRKWGEKTYPVPAILEEWYWQKVNDNFKNNDNTKGQSIKHSYLLKGLLRCGICGSNYYGRTRVSVGNKKPKDHYYMCSSKRRGEKNCGNRSISIDALDTLIWFHIQFSGRLPELLEHEFNSGKLSEKSKELNKNLEEIQEKLEAIKSRKDKIIEAIGLEVLSFEDARNELEKIRMEQFHFNSELSQTKNQKFELNQGKSEFESKLKNIVNLKLLSLLERQEITRKFIKNIEIINEDKIGCSVKLKYIDFGLKDEKYLICSSNKIAKTIRNNDYYLCGRTGENISFDLKEWYAIFKGLYKLE
jgi:site-specific DNA recombinase